MSVDIIGTFDIRKQSPITIPHKLAPFALQVLASQEMDNKASTPDKPLYFASPKKDGGLRLAESIPQDDGSVHSASSHHSQLSMLARLIHEETDCLQGMQGMNETNDIESLHQQRETLNAQVAALQSQLESHNLVNDSISLSSIRGHSSQRSRRSHQRSSVPLELSPVAKSKPSVLDDDGKPPSPSRKLSLSSPRILSEWDCQSDSSHRSWTSIPRHHDVDDDGAEALVKAHKDCGVPLAIPLPTILATSPSRGSKKRGDRVASYRTKKSSRQAVSLDRSHHRTNLKREGPPVASIMENSKTKPVNPENTSSGSLEGMTQIIDLSSSQRDVLEELPLSPLGMDSPRKKRLDCVPARMDSPSSRSPMISRNRSSSQILNHSRDLLGVSIESSPALRSRLEKRGSPKRAASLASPRVSNRMTLSKPPMSPLTVESSRKKRVEMNLEMDSPSSRGRSHEIVLPRKHSNSDLLHHSRELLDLPRERSPTKEKHRGTRASPKRGASLESPRVSSRISRNHSSPKILDHHSSRDLLTPVSPLTMESPGKKRVGRVSSLGKPSSLSSHKTLPRDHLLQKIQILDISQEMQRNSHHVRRSIKEDHDDHNKACHTRNLPDNESVASVQSTRSSTTSKTSLKSSPHRQGKKKAITPPLKVADPPCESEVWKRWTAFCTWLIPDESIGKAGKEAKQRWREKVALCMAAFFVSCLIVGVLGVLPVVACASLGRISIPEAWEWQSNESVIDLLDLPREESDSWVHIFGIAYDMENFLERHPGGRVALDQYLGEDASHLFPRLSPIQLPEACLDLEAYESGEGNALHECPFLPEIEVGVDAYCHDSLVGVDAAQMALSEYKARDVFISESQLGADGRLWIQINDKLYNVTKYIERLR